MPRPEDSPKAPSEAPLSLSRLTAAFARMLGGGSKGGRQDTAAPPPDAVTPEGVVEAMLFVGRPDDAPLSADEMAAAMRDVTPGEVDAIVERLNRGYEEDASVMRIASSPGGYRMRLLEGSERLGDRLAGRVKPVRLSPAAMEVLSIVAYKQPVALGEVESERGKPCGAALSLLVRRGLLRCDPPTKQGGEPHYQTTDRFLRLLGLGSLEQLPRSAEIDS